MRDKRDNRNEIKPKSLMVTPDEDQVVGSGPRGIGWDRLGSVDRAGSGTGPECRELKRNSCPFASLRVSGWSSGDGSWYLLLRPRRAFLQTE